MVSYLVESALLTHGLKSIDNEKLLSVWPIEKAKIAWMEDGRLEVGKITEFCIFRKRAGAYGRINYENYDSCVRERKSGALTASGTMRACEKLGAPLAVTCGMGGLMRGQKPEESHDIRALVKSTVALVATAPKDMFCLKETIDAMHRVGICTIGHESCVCDGYIFCGEAVELSGCWKGEKPQAHMLLLNGISRETRISDRQILDEACHYGGEEERKGKYFHPAVNAKIDELSNGISSDIQLHSLATNILWAEEMQR